MTDPITFTFMGAFAAICSYLALRPSREGDIDNLYPGGVAFLLWLVWGFAAYHIDVSTGGGSLEVLSYPGLAYLGFAMSAIMLLGLLEEVADRLDVKDEITGAMRR